MTSRKLTQLVSCGVLILSASGRAYAQGVDVTVPLSMEARAAQLHRAAANVTNVVVWLTPAEPGASPLPALKPSSALRLLQKDKSFSPHLLVVPTGASVEFPNRDPFFHNVFSLFNGKRFDLGLYESGASRSVRFDREGVSYIFCNIHPEMGAIILALSTPYYAVSGADGGAIITGVPPGTYRLHLWSETAQFASPVEDGKMIRVLSVPLRLAPVLLRARSSPAHEHTNKFGEAYQPPRPDQYK